MAENYTTWFHEGTGELFDLGKDAVREFYKTHPDQPKVVAINYLGSYSFYRGRARVFNEDSPVPGIHDLYVMVFLSPDFMRFLFLDFMILYFL